MHATIRKATEHDFPAVYDLIREFAVFQKTPERLYNSIEQMKQDKELFQCFVAEDEKDGIVGFASYFFTYYSWSGKGIYLDDLYVTQSHRGRQIGKGLLNAVIDFAKAKGCKKLRWQVSKWNESAIAFYKNMGAITDDVEVNCDLNLDLHD
jgi:GNAT superfamily N-acetyltransferase